MSSIFNEESFVKRLKEQMNLEIQAVVEPVIQEAVSKAEKAIRARVAVMCVSLIDTHFDVQRDGMNLRITVRGFDGNKGG